MSSVPYVSNWSSSDQARRPPSNTINIINPASEEVIARVEATSQSTSQSYVQESIKIFHQGSWSKADASERFSVLSRAATLLRARIPEFAALEVQQTGRPIREMRTQLSRIPEWLEYFAALARTYEGSCTPFKGPVVNTLTRHPIGVCLQVTPWNHPLLIAIKKIAAALAAGNVVIVKPSELAPLTVLKLGALFEEAGLPHGTLTIICGYGRETGKFLCESPGLAKIDLTGGIETYRAVAPVAAQNMTTMTAELGGKAPVCIFPSMDVKVAVSAALFAAFIASGQTCVTGSRLLVHQDIYDRLVELLVERTRQLRIGNPTDEKTQIGAVINEQAVQRCERFVKQAVEEGGSLLCGGQPAKVDGKGFFFQPTLIATHRDSNLACNEVFGPVIAIVKCSNEEDIVAVANSTNYALGASLWTNDFSQAHRVADEIHAGIVWVNGHHLNDPSSPWGGFGESGIGKENGIEAYESYTRVKSTVFNYGVAPTWFDDKVSGSRYG